MGLIYNNIKVLKIKINLFNFSNIPKQSNKTCKKNKINLSINKKYQIFLEICLLFKQFIKFIYIHFFNFFIQNFIILLFL